MGDHPRHRLRRRADRSRGATAVEYALFVALIAGVIIGAVLALGIEVQGLFNVTF